MNRSDTIGLWWDDYVPPQPRGHAPRAVRVVAVPETGWRAPASLPNLTHVPVLSIDVETFDPNLLERGPGGARRDGHLVGVSVATEDAAWYFPLRHEFEPQDNMDPASVIAWLRDLAARPGCTYVGANIAYDIEWLATEGVVFHRTARFHDVQFAEALIDDHARSVSLDTLARKYLDEAKGFAPLEEWSVATYGDKAYRANIYRSPPRLVGPYAEQDARQPLRIMATQAPVIHALQLSRVYDMECRLIPLMVAMRLRGVRVDIDRAEEVAGILRMKEAEAQHALNAAAGRHVDAWSQDSIATACDIHGVPYVRTAAGNPSFEAAWLDAQEHPMFAAVRGVRKYAKARSPFVDDYILAKHVDGRIHAQFNQLRGDKYGVRYGRFSSSTPNLQNIPSRDDELCGLIRGIFVGEPGCMWRRFDYSQIEFRFLTHYARGAGAAEARARYNADPTTDYHVFTHGVIVEKVGIDLPRKPVKNINFGLVYGMGEGTLAAQMGMSVEAAAPIFTAYHDALPFVKATYDFASGVAARRGDVRTIMGRYCQFPLYESANWSDGREGGGLPYDRAVEKWGRVRRAMTHKALSRVLQGGAADMMKAGMLALWDAGVLDVVGVPLLTVHDELGFSDEQTPRTEEAFKEVQHIMETALPLKVPVIAECQVGPTWGDCK